MSDKREIARCYNTQCRRALNHYSFSARLSRHEHLWCTAACYVRWSRERAWTQRYNMSCYRAVLSSKGNYDERQIRSHSTVETQKDGFPPTPIAVAVLATVIATFAAFS
jgi:hypothetical protein